MNYTHNNKDDYEDSAGCLLIIIILSIVLVGTIGLNIYTLFLTSLFFLVWVARSFFTTFLFSGNSNITYFPMESQSTKKDSNDTKQHNKKDDIIPNSEMFYTSPSGKYHLITWLTNKSSFYLYKKTKCLHGTIHGCSSEIKITHKEFSFLPFCWCEDLNSEDFLIYHNGTNSDLNIVNLKTENNTKFILDGQPLYHAVFPKLQISPDNTKLAILSGYNTSKLSVCIFDLLDIKINNRLRCILNIKHIDNVTNFDWLNAETLVIHAFSDYSKTQHKYSVETCDSVRSYNYSEKIVYDLPVAIEYGVVSKQILKVHDNPDYNYYTVKS